MARTLEEQWFGCERAHLARWLRIVTQHMYINVHALDLSVQFYSSQYVHVVYINMHSSC